jgi:hypothetical protein
MAVQVKFLNNNNIQFLRKSTLTNVACINDNTKTCTWACRACPEPVSVGGTTFITFTCGSGLQIAIPDADFSDSRD